MIRSFFRSTNRRFVANRVREEDGCRDAIAGARFPRQGRWRVRETEEILVGFGDGSPLAGRTVRRQFAAHRLREPAVSPGEIGAAPSPSVDAELLRRRE